jgi:stearoyl-CoA desaturase (delta-9 desaturase)
MYSLKNNMVLDRVKIEPWLLSTVGITSLIISVYWIANNFNFSSITILLITVYALGINLTIFAHRAWSHRSWVPKKYLNILGLFLFTITMVGTSIGWAAVHRQHHRHADTERDPHSPYFKSRLWIQFCTYFTPIKIQYAPDLAKDPTHAWFARYSWVINAVWLLSLYFISPELLLFWIAVLGLTINKMHSINAWGHNTPAWLLPVGGNNKGSNSVVLVMLNINNGDAWHRNHHDDPANYRYGRKWYELDPAARTIELLVTLNLAKFKN